MAMALLATVRGIPQLYYGSEIGMNATRTKVMPIFGMISQWLGC
jgi:glycosidase